ncbi:MAG: hypothetical protein QM493_02295, partial [Sulfurovum sp.]
MDLFKGMDELIQKILDVKKQEEDVTNYISGNLVENFEHNSNQILISIPYREELKKILTKYGDKKVREIYTFYYYGRDEISPSTSYFDLLKRDKQNNLDEMIQKI